MKKILFFIAILFIFVAPTYAETINIDGVYITPGKFVDNHNVEATTNYDSSNEQLTITVVATNLIHKGDKYDIYMKMSDFECREEFIYEKQRWAYIGECSFSWVKPSEISASRDVLIEVYKYHINKWKVREKVDIPLNLTIDWEEQQIDWTRIKIDVIERDPQVYKGNLEVFLRFEWIEYMPQDEYKFEITYGLNYWDDEDDNSLLYYSDEYHELSASFLVNRFWWIDSRYPYDKDGYRYTIIKVYKLYENGKSYRKPIIVLNDIPAYIQEANTIQEVRDIYKDKEDNENIDEGNISSEIDSSEVEIKEQSVLGSNFEESSRKINPKIESKINTFLDKLGKKYGDDTDSFIYTLANLNKELDKYKDKKPNYTSLIDDIMYLIDRRIDIERILQEESSKMNDVLDNLWIN